MSKLVMYSLDKRNNQMWERIASVEAEYLDHSDAARTFETLLAIVLSKSNKREGTYRIGYKHPLWKTDRFVNYSHWK